MHVGAVIANLEKGKKTVTKTSYNGPI